MKKRALAWDGCTNVRDLGGLKTCDGRMTYWGQLSARIRLPGSLRRVGQRCMHMASAQSFR